MNSRSSSLAILLTVAIGPGCRDDASAPPPVGGTDDGTDTDPFDLTDGSSDPGDEESSTSGEPMDTTTGMPSSSSSSTEPEGSSSGETTSQVEPDSSSGEPETSSSSSSGGEESSSSSEGSSSSESSSGEPVDTCGDGIVDAGEDCDDMNADDLDACHDDCSFHRVTELALGGNHTCARFDSGQAMCWGHGAAGRTGHGNIDAIGDDEPASAGGFLDLGGEAEHIVAGASHTCVMHPDGDVRCFGASNLGQLGRGNLTVIGDNETPGSRSALQLGGAVLALGTRSGAFHTCAQLSTDEIKCWGQYTSSQLGIPGQAEPIGDNETVESAPAVNVGGDAIAFAAGVQHTCALLDDGDVRCWGTGTNGALGYASSQTIGDNEHPAVAGDVLVGGDVIDITAGWYHTCVVLQSGSVRCWGRGNDGRLGYGNTAYIGVTQSPEDVGTVSLSGAATEIAAGLAHTCALLESGEVQCWGLGASGQLGYANTATIGDNETPSSIGVVDVGAPVVHIEADGNHTCAVTDSGSVRCWGHAGEGRLGYGNLTFIGDDETPASVGDVPLF
jgi:cysteine-rich repeat protein